MSGRLSDAERAAAGLSRPPRWCGMLDGNHRDVGRIKDLAAIRAAGVGAWIAKATEGATYRDPTFDATVPRMRAAGFLVGAYHFLRGAHSGATEADFFLATTRAARALGPLVLALDWESGDAPADHALAFVQRIHEVTGRWPVVYAGEPFLRSKIGTAKDPVLAMCPWWYPAYGVDPYRPHLHATWPAGYAWMQYTNGGDGPADQAAFPRKTPGIGGCDRSCFAGDETAARAWWAAQAVGLGPEERA